MIGFLYGKVLFSDGNEIIILTQSGTGYQAYFAGVAAEGSMLGLYASHIIRENSQEIYCFKNFRDKKAFELLTTVNGVGPKSAYSLIKTLSAENLIDAVIMENKSLLKEAPGIGLKSAAQIILDLKDKIKNLKMYTNQNPDKHTFDLVEVAYEAKKEEVTILDDGAQSIMREALSAAASLGFKESQILPIATKIMHENSIKRAEQLVHLVLKQLG